MVSEIHTGKRSPRCVPTLKVFVSATVLIACLHTSHGASTQDPRVAEIIEKGAAVMAGAFTAELITEELTTVHHQDPKPDGFVLFRRDVTSERMPEHKNTYLYNRSGMWRLNHRFKTAIRAPMPRANLTERNLKTVMKSRAAALAPDRFMETHISETNWHGKACYLLEQTLGKPLRESLRKSQRGQASIATPHTLLHVIGKVNHFRYVYRVIDENQNRISEIAYRNVKLDVAFPDGFFDVPDGYKLALPQSTRDYVKKRQEVTKAYHDTNRPKRSKSRAGSLPVVTARPPKEFTRTPKRVFTPPPPTPKLPVDEELLRKTKEEIEEKRLGKPSRVMAPYFFWSFVVLCSIVLLLVFRKGAQTP